MSRMVQFKTALYFIVLLAISTSLRAQNDDALVHQRWAEARTAHFIVYSSGPAREIAKIAASHRHSLSRSCGDEALPAALQRQALHHRRFFSSWRQRGHDRPFPPRHQRSFAANHLP